MKGKKSKLFIKTFCITLSMLAILVFAIVLILWSTIQPPVIADSIYISAPDINEIETFHPDAILNDKTNSGVKIMPDGFSRNDRKDLFYTFLIIGMDPGVNTDTIMIASYDGVNKEAHIVGIPRDTMVNVSRTTKKINAAYSAGTRNNGGKEGGIAQLQREVKTLIGFVPDYYVCIDYKAFVNLIDAIDGIDVYVPMNMVYDDSGQNLYINIPKGDNHLDGKEALKFARYRKGNNEKNTITDFQRIKNQQAVIKSTVEKLLNPVYLLKVPEFINIFNENVYTNIKLNQMAWFAGQLNEIINSDALSSHTIPIKGTSGYPHYYEYVDKSAIIELVNETINPYKKEITTVDVDIINE